jgi:hypothetical protein
MVRRLRMAAVAMALTMISTGLALARDDDDYRYYGGNYNQTRQYGYSSGYRDGVDKGRHEGRENDPYDYRVPDWRQASRGYQGWMGPVNIFQDGYRDGYRDGFQAGFQSVNRGGPGFYGHGPAYQSWVGGGFYRGTGNIAYNFGYQDGASVAREDLYKRKPYNPYPRGKYDDADHGYHSEYGDKNAYRAQYSNGYRSGYESVFNRRW